MQRCVHFVWSTEERFNLVRPVQLLTIGKDSASLINLRVIGGYGKLKLRQ